MATKNSPPKLPNDNQNIRMVFKRLLKNASPGLLVGAILLACVVTSTAPGVNASAHDIFSHTVHVHPFLMSSVLVVTAIAVLFHGADVLEFVDTSFLLPLLNFFSHLFSLGLGAFIPLALCNTTAFWSTAFGIAFNILVWTIVLLVMALIATTATLIVEGRIEVSRNPKAGKASRIASSRLLKGYVILMILSTVAMAKSVSTPGTTESIFSDWMKLGTQISSKISNSREPSK